ncbi:MAG: molybdopterin oxidoreductase family protein [Alphaproteobacteria bacterium]|jgi:anaerobic selenocysteine-containing dehydrogenase|nr:molybdopterin oxidoreductase family protein [Alphaproteobacteria bacterium]MBT4083379.1 molybdopterin oxidoreductase family protein [Alphaproteobacteria bacterium]MBT4542969.1 molybdopterin oxidoreductase family protein [Alphaproteobacteria bacterium]MBT5920245.1 molybdopterin oxidoreductase family protein [Alphaproteobacteria bacterium]MBT6384449.1 molybdopterin oxidoreductase family protein [Alphaproteobacteria bacterium]
MSDASEKVPEIAYSACPHDCPSTCALQVEKLDDNTIGRVHGAAENSYTSGVVCAKVARYAERTHHEGRLTTPLKRTGPKGSGQFEAISWDEALDTVADAFRLATETHGAEAVWPHFYAGTMGLVQRDGINRLRHAMGYSEMLGTVCTALVDAGWMAGTGRKSGPDPREMGDADLIVLWGTNAVTTQVNVMTHVARARKNRGAHLVVIDPYKNPTASTADTHLCLKPGSDGALACAIMHVAFRDGYADRDYMAEFTDVPEEMEAHLKDKTPEWAADITGLTVEEIEAFAKLYCDTDRAFIRMGYGFSRSRNGAVNVHAVSCIPAIVGKWKHPSGGIFYSNSGIFKWDKTLIEGLDVRDTSVRVLDQSRIGPILTGDKSDLGDGPQVTAMLIQNTNPMVIAPDQSLVHKGFARDDLFVCVHEQMMTETALMADIVLPATTFVEHDDIYQGGGHSHIIPGMKIIEAVGESRPNHYVICELAKRLGAEHRGFHMTEREIIEEMLASSGWPDLATLEEKHWHDCIPDFETAHFLNGFGWPDGKFRFKPDWEAMGPRGHELPDLPDHWAATEATTKETPFRLITPPARNFLNSTFNNTPSSVKKEHRPSLLIHPEDARSHNIGEGAGVSIGNQRGDINLHAKLFEGVQQGVVVAEGVWGLAAHHGGKGINQLVSSEAAAPAGGAVFHDIAVWVRPH